MTEQTQLSQLATQLEVITDEYAEAEHNAAVAQNAFDKAYAIAYATAVADGAKSVAAAEREAFHATLDEKATLGLADSAVKVCDKRWKAVDKRLSAAQSYYRFVRDQT